MRLFIVYLYCFMHYTYIELTFRFCIAECDVVVKSSLISGRIQDLRNGGPKQPWRRQELKFGGCSPSPPSSFPFPPAASHVLSRPSYSLCHLFPFPAPSLPFLSLPSSAPLPLPLRPFLLPFPILPLPLPTAKLSS